jgi:probable HAF family extracellular repeat protein
LRLSCRGIPFQGLGALEPGGNSAATGISADGGVIVGYASLGGTQTGFRWTAAGGMVAIPRPDGMPHAWASGVSADGSYVCGWASSNPPTAASTEGWRWNISGAMDTLVLAGKEVVAKGISADGSTVVGAADNEAFAWTAAGGIDGLGGLTAAPFRSAANAISADGLVIVGDSLDVTAGVRDAFRYAGGAMSGLGAFTATGASRDGSVVVGYFNGATAREAFRWTAAGGLVGLGTLDDHHETYATGVSGNGRFVVGYTENTQTDEQSAWVWDPASGMQILQDVLVNQFAMHDVSAWTLTRAVAISDDGKTVVGRGYNPDGQTEFWRAQSLVAPIPEPATLLVLALAAPFALHRRRRG